MQIPAKVVYLGAKVLAIMMLMIAVQSFTFAQLDIHYVLRSILIVGASMVFGFMSGVVFLVLLENKTNGHY